MGRARLHTGLLCGLLLWAAQATLSTAAHARECAQNPVTARGEPASYSWLARTKARANWRRKVRAIPGLGAAYATWDHAAEAEERCLSGPEGTVCIFTGTPCKP